MTQTEYENKKRECYEQYECPRHSINPAKDAFNYAFDRAYALDREKETITQEEIEKAAEKYADELRVTDAVPGALIPMLYDMVKSAYLCGAQDFLSKQEKDTESKSMRLSGVKSKIDKWINSHTEKEVYDLLKRYGAIEDADTVIQGWVCRDKYWQKDIFPSDLFLAMEKPVRNNEWKTWTDMGAYIPLNTGLFPDITWSDEPQEVEIQIKRKKK